MFVEKSSRLFTLDDYPKTKRRGDIVADMSI